MPSSKLNEQRTAQTRRWSLIQLNEIKLHNFGPYRGTHVIPLTPDSNEKPVILIGGMNGAGKTSLFEAIRLCLYGIKALPGRTRRVDYEEYLLDRIHRGSDGSVEQASIQITFEYAHHSRVATYQVRRILEARKNRATDDLQILKNGEPLEIEPEHWQDFINELIPHGLSRLFFFDGERIAELAANTEESDRFQESLRNLLGLELVDRLQRDLAIHITRQEKKTDSNKLIKRIADAEGELKALKKEKEDISRRHVQLQNDIDYLTSKLEKHEAELMRSGGGFAERRESLRQRAEAIEDEIAHAEEEIRSLASGVLPFTYAPTYLSRVRNRLHDEAATIAERRAYAALVKHHERVEAALSTPEAWSMVSRTKPPREKAAEAARAILSDLRPQPSANETEILHHVSDQERVQLLAWIDQAETEIPAALRHKAKRLEKLHDERRDIERHLQKAPEEDVIGPLIQALNQTSQELGETRRQQKSIEEERRSVEFKIDAVTRTLRELNSQLSNADEVAEEITVAAKTREALETYRERLAEVKLKELTTHLAELFSELSNKPGYYERVEIDAESFATSIYNRHGDLVTRDQLSAGERQMFATALIWSLAKTSGRPLPFIIDTPLGRLDHSHREGLVRKFFPTAAHQVIILSTDSEIETKYYNLLSPYLSHTYTLQYDVQKGETSVEAGYTFKEVAVAT